MGPIRGAQETEAPTLPLSPSTENPLGSPGETHRFWLLRKTHGWDITWPRGKHSSRGWENHGASWVWGPRKARMTGPREALPLLCWGTQAQVPPKEQCLKTPGQALECRARCHHGDLGDRRPRSCPHLMGDWEGGVKRLHHPIGGGGGHRGRHSCWGWTFLEAEFSTLFPKHTLQCGLILHSEMNHFVYFLYSVLTRGGSPEPSRTEKDLECGPSME